jgi:hypothetical protein
LPVIHEEQLGGGIHMQVLTVLWFIDGSGKDIYFSRDDKRCLLQTIFRFGNKRRIRRHLKEILKNG